MTEYWTPEEQGRIAEAAARIRQGGTIAGIGVPGIGYVYADGSVLHERDERQLIYVKFVQDDVAYQSHELDTSGGGSPFVKLDDKAKHEPEWLPVDWEGDSPFGDGDLKEPPIGVLYLDTE